MVDIQATHRFKNYLSLDELKTHEALEGLVFLAKRAAPFYPARSFASLGVYMCFMYLKRLSKRGSEATAKKRGVLKLHVYLACSRKQPEVAEDDTVVRYLFMFFHPNPVRAYTAHAAVVS